jgi:hypothetical protein
MKLLKNLCCLLSGIIIGCVIIITIISLKPDIRNTSEYVKISKDTLYFYNGLVITLKIQEK